MLIFFVVYNVSFVVDFLYKRPKKAIFPSFFYDFFEDYSIRIFEFFEPFIWIFHPSSQALGLGPGGTRPGPGPGACEEGWKMCFFFNTGFSIRKQNLHDVVVAVNRPDVLTQ